MSRKVQNSPLLMFLCFSTCPESHEFTSFEAYPNSMYSTYPKSPELNFFDTCTYPTCPKNPEL